MSNDIYTPKQLEFMRLWQENKLARINILEGSVRSGKTWISLVMWAFWVSQQPKKNPVLMAGKTLETLKRNCLDLLTELVGSRHFSYSLAKKQGQLFGRTVYFEGANDATSEGKIRGMTLQGAYIDEVTICDENFFRMLLSRLSAKGAKLFGTTNPDSPKHWFYRDFLKSKKSLSMLTRKFLIDDNTFLPPDYVANLKNEYSGVFYERYILGNWVVAEGLIYPDAAMGNYDVDPTESDPTGRHYISIDYGTYNAFSAGMWAEQKNGSWWRIDEYYFSGRSSQTLKTDEDYADIIELFAKGKTVLAVIIDPSASSFIATMRKRGKYAIRPAKNAVIAGIRYTATAFRTGQIKIGTNCKATHEELQAYRWDTKADDDRPLAIDDHAMDDIRYFANTILAQTGGKFYD